MTHLNRAEMETTYLETGKTFEGDRMPDIEESQAKNVAEEWDDWENTAWIDGSQMQDERVGCSVVWKNPEGGWTGEGTHLGRCREVYNAELHTIARAVRYFATRDEENQHYTIFSDCKSAIQRCRKDTPRPGQVLARTIINGSLMLASNIYGVMLRWVPAHQGMEGNEVVDFWAKEAAWGDGQGTRNRLAESQMEISSIAVQGGDGTEGGSGIHKKDRSRKNEWHK
jgi:ribonuclease HI